MTNSDESHHIMEEAILYVVNEARTKFTRRPRGKRAVHSNPSTMPTTEESGSTRDAAEIATDITSVGAERAETSSPDHKVCLESSSGSSTASLYDDTQQLPEQRFQDIGSQFRDLSAGRWPEELDIEEFEVVESFEDEWLSNSNGSAIEPESVIVDAKHQILVLSETVPFLEAQNSNLDSAELNPNMKQNPFPSITEQEAEASSPKNIVTVYTIPQSQ